MRTVTLAHDGPIARLTLARPEKLNAFNAELVDDLMSGLQNAEASGARLLVIRAEGKGFSGGLDLGGIEEMTDGDLVLRLVRIELLLQAVHRSPCATLAFVHGPCYGAAAELVAACRWRVATPDARFRMPGSRFGIVLGTRRLSNLVGADAARQLVLREQPFGADEALETGLLTRVAQDSEWPTIEAEVLEQAAALSPGTFSALMSRMHEDTGDGDLAALVRSASEGSVKERIQAYLAEVRSGGKGARK